MTFLITSLLRLTSFSTLMFFSNCSHGKDKDDKLNRSVIRRKKLFVTNLLQLVDFSFLLIDEISNCSIACRRNTDVRNGAHCCCTRNNARFRFLLQHIADVTQRHT